MRHVAVWLLMALTFTSNPLGAEAFGNNALIIPKLGMTFFDVPFLPHKKPWGLDYQWTFGTAFMQAINYRWWWVAEANMGFGKLSSDQGVYVGALSGGAGVRYNFLQDDFRPHVGLILHYLHLLGAGVKDLPLNLGWPIFVGLKPYFGLEWLFYSEMALILDGAYALYVNINEPFRQVLYATLSFAIYF